jgi:uncharacterized protein
MELSCQSCGACCFSQLRRYVRVTGDDHARLGDAAETLTEFDGNQCFMRMDDGHCTALAIDSALGTYACRVYERRPEICRALERGSPACDAERTQKRERARAALHVVGSSMASGARD